MSMAGKIAIIKSLVTSKLTYILSRRNSPEEETIKEINDMLYKFIYNNMNKQDMIKHKVPIGTYEEGGYRMIAVESQNEANKLAWMKRLISTDGIWKKYVTDTCGMNIQFLTRCNVKYADLPFKFPSDSLWDEV